MLLSPSAHKHNMYLNIHTVPGGGLQRRGDGDSVREAGDGDDAALARHGRAAGLQQVQGHVHKIFVVKTLAFGKVGTILT